MAKKRKHHADAGELIERARLGRSGMILVKYWFSVNDEEQELRFQDRMHNPIEWFHQSGALSNASTARLRWR